MAKKTKKPSPLQPKISFALFCIVIAAAWTGFALTFPFEAYSLFFAETQAWGSIVLLLLVGVVVTGPMNLGAAAVLKRDINSLAVPINAVLLTVFIHIYSVFRYSKPYLLIICVLVHIAVMAVMFGIAPPLGKAKKPKKGEKPDILLAITFAMVYLSCSYCLYMLIFQLLLDTFVKTAGD